MQNEPRFVILKLYRGHPPPDVKKEVCMSKSRKAVPAPVVDAPVAAEQAPVVAEQAPVAAPTPTYQLNEKAAAMAALVVGTPTLQTPAKGLGKAWRAAGYTAPNTRVAALAAIAAGCDPVFTVAQAQAVLAAEKANGLNLGTGTPRSYVKAFVKNGYFAPVTK